MTRILLLILVFGYAVESVAQEVPTDAWLAQMEAMMPAQACQETEYFTACFNLSPAQCNELLSEFTQSCVKQYRAQMPETLKMPHDPGKWGQVLGGCAGGRLELQLSEQKVKSAKCSDPSQWM